MLCAPPPFRREVVDFGCASGCLLFMGHSFMFNTRFGIFGHFWPFFRVQFQSRDQKKCQNRVFFAILCSYEHMLTVKVALKCV